MTEETNDQQPVNPEAENQPAEPDTARDAEEVQEDSAMEEVAEPTDDTEDAQEEQEEIDDRGVPYRNVAEEYKRKYEEMLRAQQQYRPMTPQQPAQKPKADPQKEIEQFAKDPHGYLETFFQKRKYQENLNEAESYLRKKNLNAQEILAVADEYGISSADPLKMVRSVERIMSVQKPAPKAAPKVNPAASKKRVEKIKKQTPVTGSRPPAPKPKQSQAAFNKFQETGDVTDLTDYFRKQLDE